MSSDGPLAATAQSGGFELIGRQHARTHRDARLGWIGLSGLLATALIICISAPQTDALLPESVRPVASTGLAGPFGTSGPSLTLGELIAALTLMFFSYVLVMRVADRLPATYVLMAIAAIYALVLLAPPLLSTDVFSYQAYGRMFATYGANPYLSGPHVIALDPLYSLIGEKWVNTPTAYGPLFTLLSVLIAGTSTAGSVLAYKVIAAVSSLAVVAILWHAARLRGLNQVRAIALFGLNPLVVIYGIGGGHNDLLMLMLSTAAIYLLLSHREASSGAMIAVASAIKLTAGMLLPFALASGVELGAAKRRRSVTIGAAVGAGAVLAIGFAAFGVGQLNMLHTLQTVQAEGDWHSVPGFLSIVLRLGTIGHITGAVLAAVFLAVFCWLLARVWSGKMDWIDGAGWATATMLLTASAVLPWYVAWLLPLVALCTQRRLWTVAIVITGWMLFITMIGYLPGGSTALRL
jgi:hypothetical protein